MDLNHDLPNQNRTCYRCTTGNYIVETEGFEPSTGTV